MTCMADQLDGPRMVRATHHASMFRQARCRSLALP